MHMDLNVLANDLGTPNPRTVIIVDKPQHPTTKVNPSNGIISYFPNQDYAGSDSFTYKVFQNPTLIHFNSNILNKITLI
jgi:hypothetical protein